MYSIPLILLFAIATTATMADEVKIFEPTGSIPYLSVEESLKTFRLPAGYRLEAVLTEPQIMEPVTCAFDGNGRLYVVEMRTYMQDADATGEQKRNSRVSLHEDTNGDGVMDKHSVFVDNMLLPRMVLPLDDRVLIGETNTLDVFSYRDTNGDGVADEKVLWFEGGKRGGNMEHQPSGLIWTMDNWIYTTYSPFRLRHNPGGLALKEPTAPNGGQWGLCQDNYGKPWFVNAGGERGPVNFQQPIVYGAFNVSNQFPNDYREVFPLVGIPDVQSGSKKRSRPENNTLNHFTAACGQEIFRGDRLPEDLRGDLLFSEPVGRLIRRSKIDVRDGITYLENAHPKSEFIRSIDPNFRAVDMKTGPDGCLYIVDMYRGIIQQGNWTKRGSYLRGVIDQYGFAKNIQRGRIYRLVHDDFKRGPTPKMLDESPAKLVAHLAHPNGWWRDTAQKLLILRADKTVVPALEEMVRKHSNELARMHALWTIEGLGALSPALIREKFEDSSPAVRRAAIRVSESLIKTGDKSLVADIFKLAKDPDAEVATQSLLTAKHFTLPDYKILIQNSMKSSSSEGVRIFAAQMLNVKSAANPKQASTQTPEQVAQYKRGETIYQSLCYACHGEDGKGAKLEGEKGLVGPSLSNSPVLAGHSSFPIKVLLHGYKGPSGLYAGEMIAMGSNGDEWVADIVSYIQNSFGNKGGYVSEKDVATYSKQYADRKTPWTLDELKASVPQFISDRKSWRLTASHGQKELPNIVDGKSNTRYTTGAAMEPGMWIQVELPEITPIAGLVMDSTGSDDDYPRGFRIEISQDGKNWISVTEQKDPNQAKITVDFNPVPSKFVKITQTGKNKLYWSIHDLQIIRTNK